jgi:DNA-binding winged helix-turn-helix (wHTH) protein
VAFDAFTFDSKTRQLRRHGVEVHLTPKAFDLLTILIEEAPRVVPKPELHERLWTRTFVSEAALVGLVKQLRRALEDSDSGQPLIRTSHGVGYSFAAPLASLRGAEGASAWMIVGSRRIGLRPGEHIVGRDPTCTVCLDAAGVSRRHARLTIGLAAAHLEDLASKNGTTVGDIRLTTRITLRDGDLIRFGPVSAIFRSSGEGLSTETLGRNG